MQLEMNRAPSQIGLRRGSVKVVNRAANFG